MGFAVSEGQSPSWQRKVMMAGKEEWSCFDWKAEDKEPIRYGKSLQTLLTLKTLLQPQTSSHKAMSPNSSQTASLTRNKVFNHMSMWGPFSFKPPPSYPQQTYPGVLFYLPFLGKSIHLPWALLLPNLSRSINYSVVILSFTANIYL